MLRSRTTRRAAEPSVEIAGDHPGAPAQEAFVERVRRDRARVEVDVLLADGSGGYAHLQAEEWDWLDVRTGDIVLVRPLPRPAFSG